MGLRDVIYEVAAESTCIGELCETLKWGEPSYLPVKPKVGTTVRVAWKAKQPEVLGVYFHCQTTLIDTFRTLAPELKFQGERAVLLERASPLPTETLALCIEAALTYHLWKNKGFAASVCR